MKSRLHSALRIKLSNFLSFLLLAVGLVAPTIAQEEQKLYRVELVIFRHLDSSNTTPEIKQPGDQIMRSPNDGTSYRALASENRQLSGTASSIRNLKAYQLINHLGWVQGADDIATARHTNLDKMGLNAANVSGSSKLYTRRYLHLDLQLKLQSTGAVINQSRRIRLNESHYFDHPDFGVIALVTRAN